MRLRRLLLLMILFAGYTADAQAYYQLHFSSPHSNDTALYQSFLVVYDNGTGFARIKLPGGTVYEMQLTEQFQLLPDGSFDTTIIVYGGDAPQLKSGKPVTLKSFAFLFRQNMHGGVDPVRVLGNPKDSTSGKLIHSAELLTESRLADANLILNYFTKNETFYKNRFGPKPRGFLSFEERRIRLLVLVVAQTYDSSIGPGTLLDARAVFETFTDVAAFLGIKTVFDSVLGDNYGHASVQNAINRLKPAPRDIVVFWYSGHGFSDVQSPVTRRRTMKYSFLDLLDPRQRPRPDPRDSTMNIENIYDMIRGKGARLSIVVSDCCNDEMVPKKDLQAPSTPEPKGPIPKWNWNNVYALFIKSRQSLLITSATQGQRAFSSKQKGSVFTRAFMGSLKTSLLPESPNPGWRTIWKKAQTQTIARITQAKIACPMPFQPKNTCQQVPPEPKMN